MFKTVEDIVGKLEQYERSGTFVDVTIAHEMMKVMAMEIVNLKFQLSMVKKSEVTNKLLIEHEERKRDFKSIKPMRIVMKFRRGDVVMRLKDVKPLPSTGIVKRLNGDRALVQFSDKDTWLDTRSIVHAVQKAG